MGFETHEITLHHVKWEVEAYVSREGDGALVGLPTVMGARWEETGTPLTGSEQLVVMATLDLGELHQALRNKVKGGCDAESP